MRRRDVMALGLAGTGALALGALAGTREFGGDDASAAAADAPEWLTLLGRSAEGGRDARPRVEGRIPAGLKGTLYRNGPGLFERDGRRKRHLLDGDGLVQQLSIADDGAHYRNRFVRTAKFEAEEAAGAWQYATWSTLRPGGIPANLGGGDIKSQAGVTVYPFNGALYAFDEATPAYRLNPETLETEAPVIFGDGRTDFGIKAHTKRDMHSGDWLMAGVGHGRRMKIHAIVQGGDGTLKSHHVYDAPRQIYLHDFFATENHLVFHLHPLTFSPMRFLAGLASYIECLNWQPEEGSLVMVVPKSGGEPRYFEAPASFMWHTLNAYEHGNTIVADFVGYDAPDHFIGDAAQLRRLMDGKKGQAAARGTLRRHTLSLADGRLQAEVIDDGNHEFPMVDSRVATARHRFGYLSSGGWGVLNSGIKRVDLETGEARNFDFGPQCVVGEPVFAPKPDGGIDDGWLLVQGLDGVSGTAFYAIFEASAVDAGPVARLWLDHPLPVSFHGAWVPAQTA